MGAQALIDAYLVARVVRQEADEIAKAMKVREMEAKDNLMLHLDNAGLLKIGDESATITKVKRPFVKVLDWDVFYEHIQETGEFDLLHRRPAVRAIGDRVDEGVEVPGTELGHTYDLTVTKR